MGLARCVHHTGVCIVWLLPETNNPRGLTWEKLKQIAYKHVTDARALMFDFDVLSLVSAVGIFAFNGFSFDSWLRVTCHALLTYQSILTSSQWPSKFMLSVEENAVDLDCEDILTSKAFMFWLLVSPFCNECHRGQYRQHSKEVTRYRKQQR